jgi:hypothetical protein
MSPIAGSVRLVLFARLWARLLTILLLKPYAHRQNPNEKQITQFKSNNYKRYIIYRYHSVLQPNRNIILLKYILFKETFWDLLMVRHAECGDITIKLTAESAPIGITGAKRDRQEMFVSGLYKYTEFIQTGHQ